MDYCYGGPCFWRGSAAFNREFGYIGGYKRSPDVGERRADGTYSDEVNDGRTTTTAWCDKHCLKDKSVMAVMERLSNSTGIPENNSENLQLLKYETGQFYGVHHDYIDFQTIRQPGHRILTAFIYLNDVAGGGGTNLYQLNITVMPKRGRVLIWPNVLSGDPEQQDWTTSHRALLVEKGVKYGANLFYHLRDWRGARNAMCVTCARVLLSRCRPINQEIRSILSKVCHSLSKLLLARKLYVEFI
jgi:prolyl 4-hydroxylase